MWADGTTCKYALKRQNSQKDFKLDKTRDNRALKWREIKVIYTHFWNETTQHQNSLWMSHNAHPSSLTVFQKHFEIPVHKVHMCTHTKTNMLVHTQTLTQNKRLLKIAQIYKQLARHWASKCWERSGFMELNWNKLCAGHLRPQTSPVPTMILTCNYYCTFWVSWFNPRYKFYVNKGWR